MIKCSYYKNTNGLLRQYFPKSYNFENITQEDLVISKFVNQDYSYIDEFLELQSKIFNICVESLKEFSNSKLYKKHSNIILNFEVGEYFDEDEMIKIFSYLNHDELLISEFKKSLLEILY